MLALPMVILLGALTIFIGTIKGWFIAGKIRMKQWYIVKYSINPHVLYTHDVNSRHVYDETYAYGWPQELPAGASNFGFGNIYPLSTDRYPTVRIYE